jgi:hypothetical protein
MRRAQFSDKYFNPSNPNEIFYTSSTESAKRMSYVIVDNVDYDKVLKDKLNIEAYLKGPQRQEYLNLVDFLSKCL